MSHWGRVTHICVGNLTIIGPDNGLSPGRRQAIIWTNAGILLTGPWGTNFSENLIGIHTFSFKKMHLKMSSAKWRPFGLCHNVLKEKLIYGDLVTPIGGVPIDPTHSSHNPPVSYPTMHHFVTEMCTCVVHCGIFVWVVHCGIFVWCITYRH